MSTEQLKTCKQCSKPIVDTGRFKFCSNACMTLWHDQKKHTTKATSTPPSNRTCAFCHKPMSVEAGAYGTYCSELCQRKAAEDNAADVTTKKLPHQGTCKKCDKVFATKTLPVRRYCTGACRRQALADGDFKLGPAPGVATKAKAAQAVEAVPSPMSRRFSVNIEIVAKRLGRGAVAASSKLRRGIVAGLRHLANRIA